VDDQTIKMWDLEAGKDILTLGGQSGRVSSLALSPCGKRLFRGVSTRRSRCGTWKRAGKAVRCAAMWAWVSSLVLAPDGKHLFSACGDTGVIKGWDLRTGENTLTLHANKHGVFSLALSPDGSRLFSAGQDNTIKVWDLQTGKETLTLQGHTGAVWCLALSADGKWLYSGSGDRTIKVWDLQTAKDVFHPARPPCRGVEPGALGRRPAVGVGEQ